MDKVFKSTCGICQIGCGVLVHVSDGKVVSIEGDPDSPLNKGELCSKGMASLEHLYHPDRLLYPLKRVGKRGEGKWQQISWDEALNIVAGKLVETRDRYGAESVVFIGGSFKGGYQGEFLARFAGVFGSPNVGYQGHVCFVPRKYASDITYGFYAISDIDYPPASITLWGKNLAENLHHVHRRVVRAVDNGAKLMVINPYRVEGVEKADLWLKPRPGSDLALALGILNVIISERLYDSSFVEKWTVGFGELKAHVGYYLPEKVAEITWLSSELIIQAARFYASLKPSCLHWGNAIDHGVNSFQTARALCILKAITGNLEIPGGELRWSRAPIIARDSPLLHLPEKIPQEVRQKALSHGKVLPIISEILPQDAIRAIRHAEPYSVRAAYVQGCNPLMTYSNAKETYKALLELDFLAVADMFMTPTAALGDIVLPATTYLESNNIIVPSYSMPVTLVQQKVTRMGECRSDYEILRDLARDLGQGEYFWDTEEQCLDFILEPAGITFDEFKKKGALEAKRHYQSYLSEDFPTPSGKVEIYSRQLKEWGFDPLPTYYEPLETPFSAPELAMEYPLVLTSGKRGCYRHSGGRQITSLRDTCSEPVTYIHPTTAETERITDGDWIYIETKRGRIQQKACLSPDIDPKVIVVDYAWWFPEDGPVVLYNWEKANINILTDDQPPFNREMGASALRGILCKVYKV